MKFGLRLLAGIAMFCSLFAALPALAEGMRHISKSGAVFTRDLSHPKLRNAYRDPDGRVWGNDGQSARKFNQLHAEDYCDRLGARLPSVSEFNELTFLLGVNSIEGYSLYEDDNTTPVLPALGDERYWSSERNEASGMGGEFFAGEGDVGYTSSGHPNAVICIAL